MPIYLYFKIYDIQNRINSLQMFRDYKAYCKSMVRKVDTGVHFREALLCFQKVCWNYDYTQQIKNPTGLLDRYTTTKTSTLISLTEGNPIWKQGTKKDCVWDRWTRYQLKLREKGLMYMYLVNMICLYI